jgi:Zn-dependent metalloprotease
MFINTPRWSRHRVVALLTFAVGMAILHPSSGAAAPPIPQEMTADQARAAGTLAGLKTLRVDRFGSPTLIEADLGRFRAEPAAQAVDTADLLRTLRGVLRANGSEQLRVRREHRDAAAGLRHYRMQQLINGREVIGGEILVHVNDTTSRVVSVDAQFLPGTGLPSTESFSATDALRSGLQEINATASTTLTTPRLAYARSSDGQGHLVWAARVRYTDAQGRLQTDEILVDATTGRFVARRPEIQDVLNRQIYQYGGGLIVSEGNTTSDTAAANVYTFSGDTYNYFFNTYGRDSWDGAGTAMQAYVHGTQGGQDNAAFYCPGGYTEFGDGDGSTAGPFSSGRDVVAHEWTHGVTCSEANLVYLGESGALNEGMSDIFGAAVEASITGVTSNTWLEGEDVATPGVGGDAFRYMANPTADGHSRDFYPELTAGDDVHYGSGIANLAFYLLTSGGSHPRSKTSISVTGIGMTAAARIFYLALRDYLTSSSNYSAARDATARVALEQYGGGSSQFVNTCKAWDAVDVPNSGAYCPGESATMTQATWGGFGMTAKGFNSSVPAGSLSPSTSFNGKTYTGFADVTAGTGSYSFVSVAGFASDPGASWLVSATARGTTKYGASASAYTYTGGQATWRWNFSTFGFATSGTTPVTLVHGP